MYIILNSSRLIISGNRFIAIKMRIALETQNPITRMRILKTYSSPPSELSLVCS